jgi:peptidoglycan/xylan/chitin deacetylase (PgdA/CDA1 family)
MWRFGLTCWAVLLLCSVGFASAIQGGASQHASITRHLKRHPVVALTFDDLPAAGGLRSGETRVDIATRLVRELKTHHLKGVYGFVTAVDLQGDPDTQQALRVWMKAGMKIGNHTWSHPSLTEVDADEFINNIALDEPALHEYSARKDWHWFRYPYLQEGNTLDKRNAVRFWLEAHGYRIAQVTLDFGDDDWGDPYLRCMGKQDEAGIAWLRQSYIANAKELIRFGRVEEDIAFGHEIPNVLLLHATDFTVLMLPDLMQMLRREGFRFKSLSAVERNSIYGVDPGIALADGGPLPKQFLVLHHLESPQLTPEPVRQLDAVCR